jgi:RNA recognition motif-containing protein
MVNTKSAAQIRRMKKRAEARGVTYEGPEIREVTPSAQQDDGETQRRLKAATKLKSELVGIESNDNLKAKDRRSAKRKAEAIATEESGCDVNTLLEWYEKNGASIKKQSLGDSSGSRTSKQEKRSDTPCILFVGQLSYTTTREGLFKHIQDHVGDMVTPETLKVRLLTDEKKNNRSRGIAFIETTDPEISYKCLSLHHTHLDGRRMNVERSAGGKKGSEVRKEKLDRFRKEQVDYMSGVVNRIIADYKNKGELEEGELDDGVIALCNRHSATTVEVALEEYVEERGKEMDNPSAYLTSIITRVAVEGANGPNKPGKKREMYGKKRSQRQNGGLKHNKKQRQISGSGVGIIQGGGSGLSGSPLNEKSEFAKAGIDMSVSQRGTVGDNMLKIFPSMGARGRGRGRGAYM